MAQREKPRQPQLPDPSIAEARTGQRAAHAPWEEEELIRKGDGASGWPPRKKIMKGRPASHSIHSDIPTKDRRFCGAIKRLKEKNHEQNLYLEKTNLVVVVGITTHVIGRGLFSLVYKNLLEISKKRANNSIEKWTKDINRPEAEKEKQTVLK